MVGDFNILLVIDRTKKHLTEKKKSLRIKDLTTPLTNQFN